MGLEIPPNASAPASPARVQAGDADHVGTDPSPRFCRCGFMDPPQGMGDLGEGGFVKWDCWCLQGRTRCRPGITGVRFLLVSFHKKSVQGEPCLFAEWFLMGAECLPGKGWMESTLIPGFCQQSPACSRQPGSNHFGLTAHLEK